MKEENFTITRRDELLAMQFLVQIMYDYQVINEAEWKRILTEYH